MIAEIFNRRFAERHVIVSKSFVALTLRRHHAEIVRLRRTIKHRVPRSGPTNRTWAMDLTAKADLSGRQQLVLGILDHGSRAALRLANLTDKRSLTILREVIEAIRRYGIPQRIRVDNEACFVSAAMQVALGRLGIRLQRIQPRCPWQNGRIERFFQKLNHIAIVDGDDLCAKLATFRCWYNHARPHQHLLGRGGRTPAEAWGGRTKATGMPTYFSGWNGRLVGWFFPPER
ncbi:integrase core domain-containing protein [Tahibacter soli]|uniref:Integrase core domain-containing protein n=1 Tax=Tahibacter soli TaxID=2983605 RepID=A0A9X3YLU3_9GAMM|nr:integrase core domain-containing protein [Tahibacter soli]MDC8013999.1 integrase core domain-containing protein [Tahibacter soli]